MAVLNRDGGTLRTMDMDALCARARATFARQGHSLDCRIVRGEDVAAELRRVAASPGVDAMLAGGGDGTVSTAAGIAYEAGMALGVLPAGTMNLFARALKMPLELDAALEALAAGALGAVDVATANDRLFVHQFGVGIHARLVRIREGMVYHSRIGKMLASLRAVAGVVIRPPVFDVEMVTATGVVRRRVAGIAISNNRVGDGHIPHADRLDAGVLGVYVAAPMSPGELLGLVAGIFLGTWRASRMISESEVVAVTLQFPKRKRGAQAVIDGELVALAPRVELAIHPHAMRVILPRPADETAV
ncbi:diacylglycerol/lipid kinase family protein [Devosia beringensis]|uniref:diacylglycerol/lipid kinase family protein n=1 Tax=Devosia beringensis TaxID=2657486 RepID=UPI00186B6A44|nr:diacylglycerol kinase family protein [Devosia beringensis]